MHDEEIPDDLLEVNEDDSRWKPCVVCGGSVLQIRKAFFECQECSQGLIADEEDMKI